MPSRGASRGAEMGRIGRILHLSMLKDARIDGSAMHLSRCFYRFRHSMYYYGNLTWCPGPDSNRQAVKRRIFVTLNLSKPAMCASPFVRWTMPSPWHAARAFRAASGRRPPSSLYTFQKRPLRPVSGLARRRLGQEHRAYRSRALGTRGFTEFEGFCTGRFRRGHSNF
jgi:hypothetical protein